eukprot:CAMPEP_0204268196 /NCGR_PEP_ID=MMETSP0468-20130131/11432_1 /ASSEMBLY_ACC=CAM_ASM_000383 /TAXON_ID=2969 /ORGANISM="Oxyrrhis marina" /LENGTH=63 /DNA_ID=CAMNT_0051243441 /DNA_START=186 /DNA_END=375 /DNA_ORIENTATION=-
MGIMPEARGVGSSPMQNQGTALGQFRGIPHPASAGSQQSGGAASALSTVHASTGASNRITSHA